MTTPSKPAQIYPLMLMHQAMGRSSDQIQAVLQRSADQQMADPHCEAIPTAIAHGDEHDLLAAGFALGPIIRGDQIFRRASLPKGWQRRATGRQGWTAIIDHYGRQRALIHYQAAPQTRTASLHLISLQAYAYTLIEGAAPIVDDTWATVCTLTSALMALRDIYLASAQTPEPEDRIPDSLLRELHEQRAQARARVKRCDDLLLHINAPRINDGLATMETH